MSGPLNLFPARVPIGRTADGQAVLMTEEFTRAMASLLVRVGGAQAASNTDLERDAALSTPLPLGVLLGRADGSELDVALSAPPAAQPGTDLVGGEAALSAAFLAAAIEQLQLQITTLTDQAAALRELAKRVAETELAGANVATPTDWEHPGQIGAGKANSGVFTTVNKITITAPANGATLTLADGKTVTINNTITLAGNDGATLNIGAGGTLRTAAFRNGGAASEDWAARFMAVGSELQFLYDDGVSVYHKIKRNSLRLDFLAAAASSASNINYGFLKHDSSLLFGIRNDGSLITQGRATAATVSTLKQVMPIYDNANALVGYVPIYTSYT